MINNTAVSLKEVQPYIDDIITGIEALGLDTETNYDSEMLLTWSRVFSEDLPDCCAVCRCQAVYSIQLQFKLVLDSCERRNCDEEMIHKFLREALHIMGQSAYKMLLLLDANERVN